MSDISTTGSNTTGVQDRATEVAGTAKQQAGEVAGAAKEQVAAVASTAAEQAKNVAGDAKQQARQLVEDGRQQLRSTAGEQTQRAAGSLRGLGEQLQKMASGEGGAEGPAVDIAKQASETIQRFADSLESKRPEELIDEVKRFARQKPGLFVLGALGAGFAAGRLLRTIDTAAIADAAKSGAGVGGGQEMVSGPGALGALGAGTPSLADPLAGDALAAGMAGTTPADLVDPPTSAVPTVAPAHPPRTEPLEAGGLGSER